MNAAHIIEANVRQHTVQGYSSYHMIAAAHEASIRQLAAELNLLHGVGQTPANGCYHATKTLGDASVLVEYEFSPGSEPIYDADHPGVGPGSEASVSIISVFLNGCWCDAADVVPDGTLTRWAFELAESMAEGVAA